MSDLLVFLIQLQSVFDAHAWLAQILIVVIFTAISLIAWFVFRKKTVIAVTITNTCGDCFGKSAHQ